MTTLRPADADGVLEAVRWAAAEEVPIEVFGHASKRGVGRPVQTGHGLDLSALSGVTLYEPEELVLSAKAGTPMAEIEALLDRHNQMFAFEPMDFGPLFGAARGRGTIGGALAVNSSGPRRIKAGAARDHILGIHAVSGRGEAFKSGGRVVKNVTGYDLSKGLAGSWGTLAVVTDATFKVLPKPEALTTLVVAGLDDLTAVTALCKAMGTPLDVSGAAHLPDAVAAEVPDASFASGGRAATLIRLEGFATVRRFSGAKAHLRDRPARGSHRARGRRFGGDLARRPRRRGFWRDLAPGLARQRGAERRDDIGRRAEGQSRDPLFLRLVGRADLDRGGRRAGHMAWRVRSARRSRRSAAGTPR